MLIVCLKGFSVTFIPILKGMSDTFKSYKTFCLLLILIVISTPVLLAQEAFRISLHIDSTGNKKISEIAQLSDENFEPAGKEYFCVNTSARIAWLKIEIDSVKASSFLLLDNSNLDSISFYYANQNGYGCLYSGSYVRNSSKLIRSILPAFPLPQSKGPQTFYVRVKSSQLFISSVKIYSLIEMKEKSEARTFAMSGFFFLMIFILIGSIVLYIAQPTAGIFYFTLYSFCALLFVESMSGIIYLMDSDLGYYLRPYQFFIMMSMMATAIMMTIKLLNLKDHAPTYYRILIGYLIFSAIAAVLEFLGFAYLAFRIIEVAGLTVMSIYVLAGWKVFRMGHTYAIFFTLGWSLYICVTFAIILVSTGMLEPNDYFFYLMPSVSVVDFIFIAATIMGKLNKYKKDQEFAEKEKVNLISAQNISLEQQVNERTKELQLKNSEIESLNTNLEKKVSQKTKELEQTLESLLQRHEDLEQFSYVVSHNLRSPIASILGLAQILATEETDNPELKKIAGHIESSAKSLDKVIKELNVVVSLKEPAKQIRKDIDLNEVVEISKTLLDYEIKNSGSTIIAHLEEAPSLYSVPAYIQNIFYNLIGNAIKYRKPDVPPVITITSKIARGFIEITFSDNGQGIALDPIVKDKMFSLFQQLHHNKGGKGIGLYLVKTQVEMLNGIIEVSSQPDQGAEFVLSLPLEATLDNHD